MPSPPLTVLGFVSVHERKTKIEKKDLVIAVVLFISWIMLGMIRKSKKNWMIRKI